MQKAKSWAIVAGFLVCVVLAAAILFVQNIQWVVGLKTAAANAGIAERAFPYVAGMALVSFILLVLFCKAFWDYRDVSNQYENYRDQHTNTAIDYSNQLAEHLNSGRELAGWIEAYRNSIGGTETTEYEDYAPFFPQFEAWEAAAFADLNRILHPRDLALLRLKADESVRKGINAKYTGGYHQHQIIPFALDSSLLLLAEAIKLVAAGQFVLPAQEVREGKDAQ